MVFILLILKSLCFIVYAVSFACIGLEGKRVIIVIFNRAKFRKMSKPIQMLARYFISELLLNLCMFLYSLCLLHIACIRFHLVTFRNLAYPNFAWNLIMFCNTYVSRKIVANWYCRQIMHHLRKMKEVIYFKASFCKKVSKLHFRLFPNQIKLFNPRIASFLSNMFLIH